MSYDPTIHHRKSIRYKDYDYSHSGYYFVTICTEHHKCLFGHITKSHMELNELGSNVNDCWLEIPSHFPFVTLKEYVIMPNHVHGIIVINNQNDILNKLPKSGEIHGTSNTIGSIIRGFKIGVSKYANQDIWQRNYHEKIIRTEGMYEHIAEYIIKNPYNWKKDDFFIENIV